MKLIDDTEFLVIDFETITPKGRPPEPIEVGILRIKQNKIDNNASIDWLIKPPEGLHLTRFDTSQTGITEQDLVHGIDAKRAMRIIDKSCSKKTMYLLHKMLNMKLIFYLIIQMNVKE